MSNTVYTPEHVRRVRPPLVVEERRRWRWPYVLVVLLAAVASVAWMTGVRS